jgi:hypothetical protein
MTALFLMTALACTDFKEEETTETLESRTSGTIEIKAFVPEKTKDNTIDDVLPKPDLDIDGNPVAASLESKVIVTTTEGELLTFVKKETDPLTGVETITVTVTDE